MPKNITIYSRETCSPCRSLKKFLSSKGVAYTDKDIDLPENLQEASKYGLQVVPLTVITKQDDSQEVISGFNLSQLVPAIA